MRVKMLENHTCIEEIPYQYVKVSEYWQLCRLLNFLKAYTISRHYIFQEFHQDMMSVNIYILLFFRAAKGGLGTALSRLRFEKHFQGFLAALSLQSSCHDYHSFRQHRRR
jgi:hypothetical protein